MQFLIFFFFKKKKNSFNTQSEPIIKMLCGIVKISLKKNISTQRKRYKISI